MFHFFSVSFPGPSVQPVLAPPRGPGDRLSVNEARPEPGRRESRPWQTRPFAFAQGDMSKHDIVKVVVENLENKRGVMCTVRLPFATVQVLEG
jgi:hypothetical protein